MKKITVLNETENIQTQKDSIHPYTNKQQQQKICIFASGTSLPPKRGKN